MSQRIEAGTQTRQMSATQYQMPPVPAPQAVREVAGTRSAAPTSPIREKKPNGDPCSLTLWGAEED